MIFALGVLALTAGVVSGKIRLCFFEFRAYVSCKQLIRYHCFRYWMSWETSVSITYQVRIVYLFAGHISGKELTRQSRLR